MNLFEYSPDAGLIGLALSAFLSATLLPGSSEAVLLAVLGQHAPAWWIPVLVATLFNTLGGLTSYALGRMVRNRALPKALARVQRHGAVVLVFSWVPIVGDALCVAAGWLRINAYHAATWMAVGKFVRYVVIALAWNWAGEWF
jgi:membrane protein YqaA with SNARE-associated domain